MIVANEEWLLIKGVILEIDCRKIFEGREVKFGQIVVADIENLHVDTGREVETVGEDALDVKIVDKHRVAIDFHFTTLVDMTIDDGAVEAA